MKKLLCLMTAAVAATVLVGCGVTHSAINDSNCGIIVAEKNLHGHRRYTWYEAVDKCPRGWRLPTVKEFKCLCANRVINGRESIDEYLENDYYWTSSESADKSEAYIMIYGNFGGYYRCEVDSWNGVHPKSIRHYVRCVKDR